MLFFIILILTFASGYFLPWWVVAIAAFLPALFIGKTPAKSFFAGFSAVFIVWAAMALFKSIPNDNMLAKRVATLMHLPNWILLLVITALIGGLVGGMSALSGVLVRKAFAKSK
ncbi:MAG: hypothetical protein ACTHMI_05270 [Mucilaginibacter sp.]|uniref:hypothetical protein n=1 Tax=Mucilaginibacter sp. L3T2-6 TaxID=3062491 RepID=UPI002674EFF7|nr:hypothetical protein [Mucilaginibacter sp. L3T2-6]MDO3641674.1 hypothetical protein [Mucilaginibacter sp. L3T2-6]MDV6214168.1 hypothetical protein [Mucilaginibacter sp. L3T2-6]